MTKVKSKNTKIGTVDFYVQDRKVVSEVDVTRFNKLLNLVNEVSATEYNLESLGIRAVQVKGTVSPNNVLYTGELDKEFAHYYRNGERFKAAAKRKELKQK